MTDDFHDYHKKNLKNTEKVFVDRNLNIVPLHHKNNAPTCGSKISHVWPQKTLNILGDAKRQSRAKH